MNKDKKTEFTRRISQCNRGGMIVIMYDILFAYMEEAQERHEQGTYKEFKTAIQNADRVLMEMQESLNFAYSIAGQLYALYTFARKALIRCVIKNNTEGIEDAQKVLKNLYTGFIEAARQDTSVPLMQNTQQVYVGITYGKENLTESFQEPDTSRGFLA